ncbi:YceI family protein [Lutibacter citreus]|uniref:YceI family protein n=1 Tax=Lutibacter citreus TaxID=2138210 RepID=UPI000DBE2B21|nr:YceI family protein [Lutibacter citreus]
MKKLGILILVTAFIAMSFTNIVEPLNVDVAKSSVTWKGFKPTGSHNGTVQLQSGTIEMSGDNLKGGSFIADMTTIKDADGSGKLEGHLKSKDFFEIEVFTTSKFEITNVKNAEADKVTIVGDITIKGITKEISFLAEVIKSGDDVTVKSDVIKINRADFNIQYKSKSFFNNLKEKFINDEFELQVTLVSN